ncbi:exopolysaccharide biosynthesis protein [Myxosarcina sp. GI1]|uniref:exopolysaccharide biosynthesis protein n=1 Tax=Myxosarcina sp. GI1 TaxID=1541065 RepID=UPI00055A0D66|nr:exopolysaccharide biosynthesis protein [Myxosarcina sp. GI1]
MSLKFSREIELLLIKLAAKPITLGEMLEETAERGFSLIISLLALPFLFPMPPGLSSVMGTGCLVLGGQMALGSKSPWLPQRVAKFKFPRSLCQKLLQNVRRLTLRLEIILCPRWKRVATNIYVWKSNGFCIAWLSILLMLPIPFTNPLPASTILLLAIATLEADGLVMCIGYFFTIVNTVFFFFIGYAFWQAPNLLPNFFR